MSSELRGKCNDSTGRWYRYSDRFQAGVAEQRRVQAVWGGQKSGESTRSSVELRPPLTCYLEMPHSLQLEGFNFPAYADLPPTGDAPLRGWVLLGEVQQNVSMFARKVYWCMDRKGQQFIVAIYFDFDVVSLV